MAVEKLTFEMNAVGNAVPEMKKVQNQLKLVSSGLNNASKSVTRYSAQTMGGTKSTRNFAMFGLQQAGYQVQDFAVQVAGGTSALKAFGQQAPQLLGIFGPAGAIIGAIVAVGAAVIGMSTSTKTLSFDYKKLGQDLAAVFAPLKPIWDGIKIAFIFLKDALLAGISGIINGFQFLVAGIQSVPDALTAFVNTARLTFHAFELSVQSMVYSSQAAFQSMQDMLTGTKEVYAEIDGEIIYLADQYAFMASSVGDQSRILQENIQNGTSAFDVMSNAMDNVKLIDMGSYFAIVSKSVSETASKVKNELTPAMQRAKDIGESVGSSFETAMMGFVEGTKSAKDAFKALAIDIIKELYRIFVVKRITGFITSAVSKAFGLPPIAGARAMGGPVTGGKPYLVGENGPELVVPSRNATVLPSGQGGGSVIVNQTINLTTGVQQTVRAEIRSLMPQIADSAKAAVLDAKRRGGSYGGGFA